MKKEKIVLAYSGGLDTSIILKWLQENYSAEVVAYTADIGQKINRKKIINNAKKLGVKRIIIENLKNTFVKDYVFPMIRGHAQYEGIYLLGTSIARPLIAKRQIEKWLTPESEIDLMKNQCLKRKLMPSDIAKAVLFFSSEQSSGCTNQSYVVDNGWL